MVPPKFWKKKGRLELTRRDESRKEKRNEWNNNKFIVDHAQFLETNVRTFRTGLTTGAWSALACLLSRIPLHYQRNDNNKKKKTKERKRKRKKG